MGARVADASRALARGGLVVYPTDTLWGLGARARDAEAVRRLQRAKGRSETQVVSVAVSSTEEIDRWADLSLEARAWVRRRLPGPYTVLVRPSRRARSSFPPSVLPPRGSLGIRVPDHPVARELARRSGPVVSTSANRHGEPPSPDLPRARRTFGAEVSVYLSGPPAPSGRPSTLVDLTRERPRPVRRS
jgi:L-threonylcarbamoyladenylate synthase